MNERRETLMENLPRLGYGILLNNLKNPGNIGSIIRSAHSFGCSEVILSGTDKLTQNAKKAATKKERWEKITFIGENERTIDWIESSPYNPVIVDNSEGAESFTDMKIPLNPLFIFGNETSGVETELLESDYPVAYIPQIGADKSINVACAAAIIMYSYFLSKWKTLERIDDWNCCYSPGRGEVIR
jgi:TrmH family RNA methyltransferase